MINKLFVTLILLLFSFSCKETPPEPGNGGGRDNGMLTVEDVGVTDAVLRLRVPGGFKSRCITLKRLPAEQAGDTTTILSRQITSLDTIIIDENLLPKHSYRYVLTVNNFFNTQERYYAGITTMDTTSHNFTWQIDTLGDGNSSILRDVAMINDTLAYAVGEIYHSDSLNSQSPFGLAIWNGKKWTLKRLYFNCRLFWPDCVPAGDWLTTGKSVFSTGQDNIWIAASSVKHFDGKQWYEYAGNGAGSANKIWGSSPTNMYFVGSSGLIVHYDGSRWERIESGTDVNFTDVWGSPDGKVVWACGYFNNKRGTCLLRCMDNTWEVAYDGTPTEFSLLHDTLSGALTSVYTPSSRYIYVCSHFGLYRASANTRGEAKRYSFTSSGFPGFPRGMRGSGINDITIAGDYTMIARWNGITWRYYEELRNSKIHFNAVAQKRNLVVAVGVLTDPIHGKGVACIGKRK
ncbi:MAG: hypothetical protein C0417_06090 [Chlorobiaceae bacterium]|nr:hypothetical protein [Chlorobiaceae bacterium]